MLCESLADQIYMVGASFLQCNFREVNMEISNIKTWSDKTENGTPIVEQGKETNKEIFLEMLVGQMTNQDPFNPQDPTQYITQLAQFSSLEQMMSMNEGIEHLVQVNQGALINSALSTSSALIGKEVQVSTSNDKGENINYSGVLKSISVKDGNVFLEVKLNETGEIKEFPYSSLIKVKEATDN